MGTLGTPHKDERGWTQMRAHMREDIRVPARVRRCSLASSKEAAVALAVSSQLDYCQAGSPLLQSGQRLHDAARGGLYYGN